MPQHNQTAFICTAALLVPGLFFQVAGAVPSSTGDSPPTAVPVLAASFADGSERITAGAARGVETSYHPAPPGPERDQSGNANAHGALGHVIVSSHGQGPEYVAPALIDGRSGTVSLWFSPQNWDNHENQGYNPVGPRASMVWIGTPTAGSDRLHPPLISASIYTEQLRDRPANVPLDKNTWHHLVIAWVPDIDAGVYNTAQNDLRVYLDGERLDRENHRFAQTVHVEHGEAGPDPAVTKLVLGELRPRLNHDRLDTAMRQFQLYERALTDAEVANLYRQQSGSDQPAAPVQEVVVDARINPALHRLDLEAQLLTQRGAKSMSWQLAVQQAGSGAQVIASDEGLALDDGWAGRQYSALPLQWGQTHKLAMQWHDSSGKPVFTHSTELDSPPAPVWLGSQLGLHPGEAMPGFDPVRVNEPSTVQLWQRRIRFAGNGLPEQIEALGDPLLAEPMSLSLATARGHVPLTSEGQVHRAAHDDEQATLEGAVSGDGWRVTTRSRSEFDGMIRFDVRIEPPQSPKTAELTELTIELPLRARAAQLYALWNGRGFGFRNGNDHQPVPESDGVFFASHQQPNYPPPQKHVGSFIPYFMFTDGHHGLAWFAESDRGWTVSDKTPALTASREGDKVVLRLNVIREPTTLEQPLELVFGLHVLPIRPMAEDHRSFRDSLHVTAVDAFNPPSFRTEVHRADKNALWPHGGWDAANARLHARDEKVSKSTRPFSGSLFYLSRPWPGLPPEAEPFQPQWYLPGYIHHTPAYQDCFAYWMHQWLTRTDIRGFYIDDIWPPPMNDPILGPAYYLPDGSVQGGYDFFAQRELLKRLRWLFHDTGRRPTIWIHNTQTLYPNLLAFAEAFYDGETPNGVQGGEHFQQRWPLHRVAFDHGRLWGATPVFMNIYKDANTKLKRYQDSRSFFGEMFLHDLGFDYSDPYLRAHQKLFTWRTDDLQYIGYDDRQPLATSDHESVYVSAYVQGPRDNPSRVYLVVVNRSAQPVTADVRIQSRAGWHGRSAPTDIDVWTPQVVDLPVPSHAAPILGNNQMRLDLRPWDFRLMTWERD